MQKSSFAVAVVMLSRAVYAVNWYNVSPAYPFLVTRFPYQAQYIWMLFAVFLIGAGIFQVPAGMVAAKIGSRKTAFTGLTLMGVSASAIYFSDSLFFIIVLRFLTGVSAAFFFSSAVSVLGYLQPEKIRRNMGIYNGSFAFGAGIGILPYSFFINYSGWRLALTLGGVATLAVAIAGILIVPDGGDVTAISRKAVARRMFDRYIWLISAGMGGYYSLNFVLGEYFKPYMLQAGFGNFDSAVIASLTLFLGLAGALFTGLFSRIHPVKQVVSIIIILSLIDFAMIFYNLYLFLFIAIINGVLNVAVFSKEYLLVMIHEPEKPMIALDLGLLNSIQLTIGGVFSALFGISLDLFGYHFSWILICIISLSTLPLFVYSLRSKSSSPALR
ncbi:MAG: MFS transporter [Candidatus Thermoplasmatota archaeon]|nr:MFS transporter [Candidatus Thermoplasmatota archaeon]MCL5730614.1 MFS transporter [Candidatus Thermoplasmatota archaeon]